MADFRDCVADIEVEDIAMTGINFTWNKKPGKEGVLLKKLDRFLGNVHFMSSFPLYYAQFLPYMLADHTPAVLVMPRICNVKPKPFKFHNYLTNKDNFILVVRKVWSNNVDGFSMFSLVSKLKMLKKPLRKLNFEQGNLFDNVKCLKAELADVHNNSLREKELRVLKAYKAALKDEELFLRQKAKVEWLEVGDRNSKYFHNVVKGRSNRNKISYIEGLNDIPLHGNSVGEQFVSYFKNILGRSSSVLHFNDPDSLFVKKLLAFEALNLVRSVSNEEIKLAMSDIDGNKAPSLDGFSSQFFKESWSIVGDDVCKAVRDFFSNGKLLKEVNSTAISLVPKVASPSKVSDYRPIVCCNVVYKIISKVICNRLKGVLGILVDDNQSAFIPSRQISDNIMLSQELMRNYHRNRGPAKCTFKIDIEKAYDMVEWDFLSCCLKHFGFLVLFIKWIMSCVTSTSFTVNVNGDHTGFFKGMRGLKQGDPLSPYLFTLVMEVFNLVLKREIDKNPSFRFHWQCRELKLTHLCFADDLLLLCNGDSISVSILKNALTEFGGLSGLLPNVSKSIVFFGNVREVTRLRILNIMPFREGSLPVRYLGVPLISKRLYIKDCQLLIDKARKRLLDWKNKSLSFASRLQLIMSVV
ncbi:RNA-directed DNA polymerase, eukaryota, reverse transcriptase zinc-binding domain protein [Tanacetum coccineum]